MCVCVCIYVYVHIRLYGGERARDQRDHRGEPSHRMARGTHSFSLSVFYLYIHSFLYVFILFEYM